jgi:hypothetical protein
MVEVELTATICHDLASFKAEYTKELHDMVEKMKLSCCEQIKINQMVDGFFHQHIHGNCSLTTTHCRRKGEDWKFVEIERVK